MDKFGIHCWGWNLCPSQASRSDSCWSMRRRCFSIFTRRADGVLIESSDYAICHCRDCTGHFYEREFDFVKKLSARSGRSGRRRRSWSIRTIFRGRSARNGCEAARKKFDPRWTLFFTPQRAFGSRAHSQARRASGRTMPALRDPAAIAAGGHAAREAGVSGYVPSLRLLLMLRRKRRKAGVLDRAAADSVWFGCSKKDRCLTTSFRSGCTGIALSRVFTRSDTGAGRFQKAIGA